MELWYGKGFHLMAFFFFPFFSDVFNMVVFSWYCYMIPSPSPTDCQKDRDGIPSPRPTDCLKDRDG